MPVCQRYVVFCRWDCPFFGTLMWLCLRRRQWFLSWKKKDWFPLSYIISLFLRHQVSLHSSSTCNKIMVKMRCMFMTSNVSLCAVHAQVCSILPARRYGEQRQVCHSQWPAGELRHWAHCVGGARHQWPARLLSAHPSRSVRFQQGVEERSAGLLCEQERITYKSPLYVLVFVSFICQESTVHRQSCVGVIFAYLWPSTMKWVIMCQMAIFMFLHFLKVNSVLFNNGENHFQIRGLVAELHVFEYGGTTFMFLRKLDLNVEDLC